MRSGALIVAAFAVVFPSVASAADQDPICADRPGKATPTCIVPRGTIQVETGLADWTREEVDIGQTAVKVGVSDRLHLEVDLPAVATVRRGSSGLTDSALAFKYRLTAAASPVQLAVRPFVKLPTAHHALGNGKVEGGVALLADSTLAGTSAGWNVAPEVDLVADADGSGYHLATVQAASLGVLLSGRMTLSGELWAQWDFDPAGTVRQYSADVAAALLVSANAQIDAGINFGLNRNTPSVEAYTGIAVRF